MGEGRRRESGRQVNAYIQYIPTFSEAGDAE